jgi:hypothetical protein
VFTHLDGREYSLRCPPGSWGGWAELDGLGLSSREPLLVVLQPLFPREVPPEARADIVSGLGHCTSEPTQSLMLQALMPELTR